LRWRHGLALLLYCWLRAQYRTALQHGTNQTLQRIKILLIQPQPYFTQARQKI